MGDSIFLFVPGRLCLFGEHSDWAGLYRTINADIAPGLALVTGIDQGIYAAVKKAEDFIVRNTSDELHCGWVDFRSKMCPNELKAVAESDSYFSYVAGVASYISELYYVGGIEINITKMTLPIKSGLSSSAAICVLVARAFNLLYGLNMNTLGEMSAAYRGERRTRSRCGRLDQACAFGTTPVAMTFDGEEISVERLVVKKPLHWVFANLKAEKDTIRILSDLNKCYPFPENDMERSVHDALGSDNLRIVRKAVELIRNGDVSALGLLMSEAQAIFDKKVAPASSCQLSAPRLHSILQDETVLSLTYGGKGVGSQGDGSVQFMAKDESSQRALAGYLSDLGLEAYAFTIPARRQIHKAVIPVAGFGTRLYPATRSLKKEFIPVVDRDGLAKPIILLLLEELYDSGIEEVCLIVGSQSDIDLYKRYFQEPLEDVHLSKLPPQMRDYEDKILRIGRNLQFRVQEEKKGFGHAVYQSRDFCGDEPVLLLLGDTIYRSNIAKSCCMQMIEAYEEVGHSIVSIHEIPVDQVVHYGILSGDWENSEQTVMRVKRFVEKPSLDFAGDYLAVKTKQMNPAYYSVFGQYVLTPDVFNALEINIEAGETQNGEYQLTSALASLIDGDKLTGIVLDGTMFDVGNSKCYKTVVNLFGETK